MNEIQINYLLKTNKYTKKRFRGTFAADELKKLELNSHYIVNLDTRQDNGSHWILLTRSEQGKVYYFCTSGIPPFELNLVSLLEKYPIIYYSPENIQSIKRQSCGAYCILVSYLMSRGFNLREAINIFTDDHIFNEVILWETIKKYFHNELF
jgi:hypothetical protein